MQVNVSTNGYKVIGTGMVFSYDHSSDIKIEMEADNGFSFNVIWKFEDDDSGERNLSKETVDNTIVFKCINFHPHGSGTTVPISIATIDGKEWFVHFWGYRMGNRGPHKVEYSILAKE